MSDDQGWGDAGYQGHPELKTPNLDKMAANGLKFNRFYSAAPVCSPTRGSVLTGRHPSRYGVVGANSGHILKEEILLSEVLKENGYKTGHFGKWHLGVMSKYVIESNRGGFSWSHKSYAPPWENGFDVAFSTESAVPTFDPMIKAEDASMSTNITNKGREVGDSFGTYYWTGSGCLAESNLSGDDSRVIMDRVVPFIEQAVAEDQHFFSVIWFHSPHSPVVAGSESRKMYNHLSEEQQHYYGCITAMDEQIGRLREMLRKLNVERNTMIWFCSDNGPAAQGGGPGLIAGGRQQGSTGGFKERKGSLSEGGVRVPGILEWPNRIEKARETDFPAVTSDYFPTILDLLGIEIHHQNILDGISLKKLIDGEETKKRSKPIGFQAQFQSNQWSVWNDNQYKLMVQNKNEKFYLFDLYKDPYESENIADQKPEIVDRMNKELTQWLESCDASYRGEDYK